MGEFTARIADHLELAERNEEMARYLSVADKDAAAPYANDEAVRASSRTLDINLTLPDSIEQVQLHRQRARVCEIMGFLEKAQRDLEFILGFARDYQKTGDYSSRRLRSPGSWMNQHW